jgi:hypothetical protein
MDSPSRGLAESGRKYRVLLWEESDSGRYQPDERGRKPPRKSQCNKENQTRTRKASNPFNQATRQADRVATGKRREGKVMVSIQVDCEARRERDD